LPFADSIVGVGYSTTYKNASLNNLGFLIDELVVLVITTPCPIFLFPFASVGIDGLVTRFINSFYLS